MSTLSKTHRARGLKVGATALALVLGLGIVGTVSADPPYGPRHGYGRQKEVHVYHYYPEPRGQYRRGRRTRVYHHYPAPAYGYAPGVDPYGLLGAAAGGYIGSEVTEGDPAATAAGAVSGYIFGSNLGRPYYRY
jgi:hypothetical protein